METLDGKSERERSTVKPPRRDRIGDGMLVLVERLVPSWTFSFKFIVCHYNPPHNDRA